MCAGKLLSPGSSRKVTLYTFSRMRNPAPRTLFPTPPRAFVFPRLLSANEFDFHKNNIEITVSVTVRWTPSLATCKLITRFSTYFSKTVNYYYFLTVDYAFVTVIITKNEIITFESVLVELKNQMNQNGSNGPSDN